MTDLDRREIVARALYNKWRKNPDMPLWDEMVANPGMVHPSTHATYEEGLRFWRAMAATAMSALET